MTHRLIRALLPLVLLAAQPARAWGEFAHRLTGNIAWNQLTPAARAEVRRLLRAEALLDTPDCRLASIEDATVWPDCVRGRYSERFAFSSPWHYQNISVCEPFDINAKCPNGDCVTAQIPRQQVILADRSLPARARLQAFSFLVHFVGDMHQPLHLGDKGDLGGNAVRVSYGFKAYDRMNLHRIWDSELAERALTEPPAVTPQRITSSMRRAFTADPEATRIAIWARDAWEISRRIAYPELQGYPDSCPIPSEQRRTLPRGTVTPDYITKATPATREQVAKAGTRIALLVNEALAPGGRTR